MSLEFLDHCTQFVQACYDSECCRQFRIKKYGILPHVCFSQVHCMPKYLFLIAACLLAQTNFSLNMTSGGSLLPLAETVNKTEMLSSPNEFMVFE